MSLEEAIRYTEILLGFAFAQQSIEHVRAKGSERIVFGIRFLLSLLLIVGFQTAWAAVLLLIVGLELLRRFQGPYNGGADRMSLLILCCLCLTYFLPTEPLRELAFGYLAIQLVLSYFISGFVKIINPDWRSGRALRDVFQFSAYPAAESFRELSDYPRLLFVGSWAVMLFELLFPFSLLSSPSLFVALCIAAMFHFSNACFLGLNRFFWIWIAAYPSIIWLQMRVLPEF